MFKNKLLLLAINTCLVCLVACEQKVARVQTLLAAANFACQLYQSVCQVPLPLPLKNSTLNVAFDQSNLLPEHNVRLLLTTDDNEVQLLSAQGVMTGKNMYMGKIPLIFDAELNTEPNGLMAEILFGSCSEKKMVWLLTITITYQIKEQIISTPVTFEITSDNNNG